MPFRSTMFAATAALALVGGSAVAQSSEPAKTTPKPAAAVKPAPKAVPSGGAKTVNESASKAKTEAPQRSMPADSKSDDGCHHAKGSAADA